MLKNWQETLEYAFEVLNHVYFDDELPMPVITLQSSPRSYGHFTVGKVWRAEDNHLNEINISVEHLEREIERTCATLMHEMIHYYCQIKGIADTSKNGRYHNKNFKTEAEKRGLVITQEKYIGWSVTAPTEEFIQLLDEHGIVKPSDMNRDGITDWFGLGGSDGNDGTDGTDGTETKTKKPKCSTRKYQCPCCENSFRATKDINVLCMDCNEQFIKIEKS